MKAILLYYIVPHMSLFIDNLRYINSLFFPKDPNLINHVDLFVDDGKLNTIVDFFKREKKKVYKVQKSMLDMHHRKSLISQFLIILSQF